MSPAFPYTILCTLQCACESLLSLLTKDGFQKLLTVSLLQTFWVDKPARQARSKESGDTTGIARSSEDLRENEADVPLYDRVTPSLSGQELKKDG